MENSFDIILISWNRLDYLKRTMGSLINSGAVKDCQRLIIVDNGSTEEGVREFIEDMRRDFGAFVVFRPHNNGWGSAVNDALGLSRAPFLLLANNDVEFNPGFHTQMLAVLQKYPSIGLLGAWRHTSHGFVANGTHNADFREMDDIPAVAWMLPKSAMQQVGMLPEHGPCFTKGGNGEDSKYVQKIKAAGLLTGVTATDVARHMDGY